MLVPLGERILNFLERNADAEGNIRITHQQLADHLGVTREAVSRETARLKQKDLLRTARNKITLRQGNKSDPQSRALHGSRRGREAVQTL